MVHALRNSLTLCPRLFADGGEDSGLGVGPVGGGGGGRAARAAGRAAARQQAQVPYSIAGLLPYSHIISVGRLWYTGRNAVLF